MAKILKIQWKAETFIHFKVLMMFTKDFEMLAFFSSFFSTQAKSATLIFPYTWRYDPTLDPCSNAHQHHGMTNWRSYSVTDDATRDIQHSGVIIRVNSIHQQGLNFISMPLDTTLNTFWFNLLQWIASHFSLSGFHVAVSRSNSLSQRVSKSFG